ncbi:MAG: hypothetical protein M3458_15050 [Acidobacteriota bacterium]|nr:hypothetical protein [Acidobacteriota bacterium]
MAHTNVFTEEGMTRLRNFKRRTAGYVAVWLMCGAMVAFALFWLQMKFGLQPLQRVYLKQYAISSLKTTASKRSQSKYTLLVRTAIDPATKKDVHVRVTDEDAQPVLDARGKIVRDPKLGLMFTLRSGIPYKYFYWQVGRGRDAEMYPWMRTNIYDGKSFLGLCSPMLVVGGVIFFSGLTATINRDRRANKRYEQGRAIRGTRELSPEEYEREQEAVSGIGIVVYNPPERAA